MKSIFKKILVVVLIVVGILTLWAFIDSGYQAWQGYKWQKQTAKFQDVLEQPYKEDFYGGKTPEETWGMFLDALKKGNVELASKYYDVAHQERAKEMIEKIKQEDGQLQEWIKDLEGLQKSSRESLDGQAQYYYNYFDKQFKQTLSAPVNFYFNPYTKVWKIISL